MSTIFGLTDMDMASVCEAAFEMPYRTGMEPPPWQPPPHAPPLEGSDLLALFANVRERCETPGEPFAHAAVLGALDAIASLMLSEFEFVRTASAPRLNRRAATASPLWPRPNKGLIIRDHQAEAHAKLRAEYDGAEALRRELLIELDLLAEQLLVDSIPELVDPVDDVRTWVASAGWRELARWHRWHIELTSPPSPPLEPSPPELMYWGLSRPKPAA